MGKLQIKCENCELKDYLTDLEEECENLSEENRILSERVKQLLINMENK